MPRKPRGDWSVRDMQSSISPARIADEGGSSFDVPRGMIASAWRRRDPPGTSVTSFTL
jgi:hypothetical protein